MDRFESNAFGTVNRIITDLHSNMDRFESHAPLTACSLSVHLHSNMDRFESLTAYTHHDEVLLFTFQYG